MADTYTQTGFPDFRIPPVVENFATGPAPGFGFQIEAFDVPPAPRLWFLNESGTELIQVQEDRFIHNWRKTDSGQQYPRYEYIRGRFNSELQLFSSFLEAEKLPRLVIN